MIGFKHSNNGRFFNNKGFTLIEIAVVLVIIGLIIGAAVKGKDLIQSGKQKKFYTSYMKAWEMSVVSYYDRTGQLLGDGTANGGTAAAINGAFDNVGGATFGVANGINARLTAVGLTVPTTNSANSGQMSYSGQFSGNQTITLTLLAVAPNNALSFALMPTDLAIAIDTMVDGNADGTAGNFRNRVGAAYAAWPNASTTTTVTAHLIIDVP